MRWRVRTPILIASLIVLAVTVWGSVASATTSQVRSEPNGDLGVTVSVGSLTDRDRDSDFNTVTKNDIASMFFAVANNADITQTVRIDYALDGPGTALDRAFTKEVVLAPGDIHQEREEFKVGNRTPKGVYSLTVTGSGTETATTTATFTNR
jgi:hypothetical protein